MDIYTLLANIFGIMIIIAVVFWVGSIIFPIIAVIGEVLIFVLQTLFYVLAIPILMITDLFRKGGDKKREAFQIDAKNEFKELLKQEKEKRQKIGKEREVKPLENQAGQKEDGINFNPYHKRS